MDIKINKQQTNPSKVHNAPVHPKKLGLAHPYINATTQARQHLWHLFDLVRQLSLTVRTLEQKGEITTTVYVVVGKGFFDMW